MIFKSLMHCMPDHGRGEARHPGHSLQEDAPDEDGSLIQRVQVLAQGVAAGEVKGLPQEGHRVEGGLVGQPFRGLVLDSHRFNLGLGPNRMRQ